LGKQLGKPTRIGSKFCGLGLSLIQRVPGTLTPGGASRATSKPTPASCGVYSKQVVD
jgi:hypothetical protein